MQQQHPRFGRLGEEYVVVAQEQPRHEQYKAMYLIALVASRARSVAAKSSATGERYRPQRTRLATRTI